MFVAAMISSTGAARALVLARALREVLEMKHLTTTAIAAACLSLGAGRGDAL